MGTAHRCAARGKDGVGNAHPTWGDPLYAETSNHNDRPFVVSGGFLMMPKTLDEAQSREVAKAAKSRSSAPFDNAYAAIVLVPDAVYVQGFVVFPGAPYQPIEHAWLEVGETIVDPSFPGLKQQAANLYYFPAQELTLAKLKSAIEEAKEDYPEDDPLPIYGKQPYDYYGDLMLGGSAYTTALAAAETKCRELNAAKPKST